MILAVDDQKPDLMILAQAGFLRVDVRKSVLLETLKIFKRPQNLALQLERHF